MPSRSFARTILVLDFLILLFAASAVLSLYASYDPTLSYSTMNALLASVGVYFVVARAARPRRAAHLIVGSAVLIALEVSLFFVTQFDYQKYAETPSFIQQVGKLTTLLPNLHIGYLHPNAVATFLEMALPIGLALVIALRRSRWRWAWAGTTVVIAYAFLLTASRGAWLGLAGAGVVWFVVRLMWGLSRTKALLLLGLLLLVGCGIIGALIILGPRIDILDSTIAAATDRLELYRNSLYLIRDYAFTGIGLGNTFAMVYSRFGLLIYVPFVYYSSNLLLAVWFGQGLLGILSFTSMIILFYAYVYQVIHRARGGAVFYGAWVGVTATLLHGLSDARQYIESPWVMPALFFGVGLTIACGAQALHQSREAEAAEADPRSLISWRVPLLIALLGTAFLAVTLFVSKDSLQAIWYTNLGALDETRADEFVSPQMDETERRGLENTAQNWYEQALVISPGLSTANRRLGIMLVGQGEYAQAVPLLEQAATAEPDNPAAIKGLGLAYVWVGRTADAAATFNQLSHPLDAYQELGVWYSYREDQELHILAAYALETIALMSNDPVPDLGAWLQIADTYLEGGDTEHARMWYEKVLAQDANDPRALEGLAAVGA